MNSATYLSGRLNEVFLYGKWIANTNYKEQLENISFDLAIKKYRNLNSITALTFHVNYYVAGVLNVLKGGNLEISDKFSFDMPVIENDEKWSNLKTEFLQNAEEFAKVVEQMSEEQLQCIFVKEDYGTYYRNIEALIEHAYYHLGQITLIKKLATQD